MTSFTLVRRIAARPSIVFDALATADGVAAWWGPDELPVLAAEVDARVGGAYRVRFQSGDGREHEACGEYLELVRPERLVMTYRYASGGEPEELGRTSRIEITLTPIETGTELTFVHGGLKNDVSVKSHEGGWTGAFRKLVRRFEGASAGAGLTVASGVLAIAASFAGAGTACAQPPKYPAMAQVEAYRMASQAEEVALAESAAPPSVSHDAEVLVLGSRSYETARRGTNGFVCIVERSWANDFGNEEFWNPKVRGPICFNPASARTVLPTYLKRTEWVLARVPAAEMLVRTKAAIATREIVPPDVGAMCFMMSKGGYLGDGAGGHWHPHVMFYLPRTEGATWGANLPGSPVIVPENGGTEPLTVFISLVPKWSDGTPALPM